MAKLQSIENKLQEMNGALFQELCDKFLALRNRNYISYSRTGSVKGKQKTKKGTPDSFLILPNEKFIFIEYTTQDTSSVSKLKDDISKCLDEKKTKIPISQIEEIILCTNFSLDANAQNELIKFKNDSGGYYVQISFYTLDSLAIELSSQHRNLVHEYLDLPLDTGSIISIEQFVKEYDGKNKGIATPLDNEFFSRKEELNSLFNLIDSSNLILLHGAPGVGKTKLSIQAINLFLEKQQRFNAYCISYKNCDLIEDLYQYFDNDNDIILFVDDANRIDRFDQILSFFQRERKGELKIILTVRDYAFSQFSLRCNNLKSEYFHLDKMTDEDILKIIKSDSFRITNPDYHQPILNIAEGNPRIAIMAAKLALKEQHPIVLSDVSELFEKYFSTFIADEGEFNNNLNLKCLGIISFFHAINFKEKETLEPTLNLFNINYYEFQESIDKLENLEIVEKGFDHVKIPEQNLSTFFFYKVFIKDQLLSFKDLLTFFFDDNKHRFKDTVIPSNNIFGPTNVMNKLSPFLKEYYNTIKSDFEKGYNFLATFWYYLQNETFSFLYNYISQLPNIENPDYKFHYELNEFSHNNNQILDMLSNFFRSFTKIEQVMDLAFEYVEKEPQQLARLIYLIRSHMLFDYEDLHSGFRRQTFLFDYLINKKNNNEERFKIAFFQLSKTFLKFKYQHTKSARHNSIQMYQFEMPNNELTKKFRTKLWVELSNDFETNSKEVLNVLSSYSEMSPDVISSIMKFDITYLVSIINSKLNTEDFEHCVFVQNLVYWCRRNNVEHDAFDSLKQGFTNEKYNTYLRLDWNRLRDKDFFDYDDSLDWRKYEELKAEEVRTYFKINSIEDFRNFHNTYVDLLEYEKSKAHDFNKSLEYIIDNIFTNHFNLGCTSLEFIISNKNDINYYPRIVFKNNLNTKDSAEKIWEIISSNNEYKNYESWKISFFDLIDESLLQYQNIDDFLNIIKDANRSLNL